MASAESAQITCPVCHQADQVKTMQTAYSTGVARTAPPDMPTRNVSMMPYITACIILVGIFIFLTIVFVGGLENHVPEVLQLILAVVTIITIISALAVSYYAFQRVVRGDNEASIRYPAWDKAVANWQNLRYCSRDDVVFDPKNGKVFGNEDLAKLRIVAGPGATQVQSALASH